MHGGGGTKIRAANHKLDQGSGIPRMKALLLAFSLRSCLREFDLSNPGVKAKMRERYGKTVPMNEPVNSPRGAVRITTVAHTVSTP